jgi:hypothetical protein
MPGRLVGNLGYIGGMVLAGVMGLYARVELEFLLLELQPNFVLSIKLRTKVEIYSLCWNHN